MPDLVPPTQFDRPTGHVCAALALRVGGARTEVVQLMATLHEPSANLKVSGRNIKPTAKGLKELKATDFDLQADYIATFTMAVRRAEAVAADSASAPAAVSMPFGAWRTSQANAASDSADSDTPSSTRNAP